jgi:hypothetical protein
MRAVESCLYIPDGPFDHSRTCLSPVPRLKLARLYRTRLFNIEHLAIQSSFSARLRR